MEKNIKTIPFLYWAMKRNIKSNPFLFWTWYQLYHKKWGKPKSWFSADTQLYFDGYPRSGNTFGVHLIRSLWPKMNIVDHFHAIAPLKVAIKRKVPAFILFRDPENAITSAYIKYHALRNKKFSMTEINTNLLKSMMDDYKLYYQWVLNNKADISLIDFKVLVKKPDEVMLRINEKLPQQYSLNKEDLIERVNHSIDKPFGSKDKLGASLPTKEKDEAKNQLKTYLTELPGFPDNVKIYERLISRSK